jgi:CheY-like chemotaxis protein
VLSNFVNNALKFTTAGTVDIAIRRCGDDRVRMEVRDSGPGIDAVTRARLFQPFTQGDESTTRRYGGTGLGLSICRQLAELMGGAVGVESEPGRGSLFWAELPLPPSEDTEPISGFGALSAAALEHARVLVVEDNPVNMMICTSLLEQHGMRVAQAVDGRQAIDAVEAARREGDPFDVVLMDVQMPVMSGHEATRVLRQRYDARSLPIIALTAAALVSEREQALAAGMNDFLTKPIEPHRLLQAVARALGED